MDFFAVRPFYQKIGVGEWMMKQVKDLMTTGGYDYISMHATKASAGFYTKLGNIIVLFSLFFDFIIFLVLAITI